MALVNNIFNIRVNNVSSNGSVNFGNVIVKGNMANSKMIGGQTIVGDSFNSPSVYNFNRNIANDPDVNDQAQAQL